MELMTELVKFIGLSLLIVVISKYLLVRILRKLAESLELAPKAVGNIAGIATSVPELLTVSLSAISGLIGASIYNIVSSNLINVIQYSVSIILNKNQKVLRNRALKMDLWMVFFTILIPLLFIFYKIPFSIHFVPLFFFLLILCYTININSHKMYIKKQTEKDTKEIANKKSIPLYGVLLILVGTALYIVGDQLGNTLENLCYLFNVPETIIGIALGFITSLPELITFFESQKHHKTQENEEIGVIEATNNLLTSNLLNLCVIQSIGILLYTIVS